MCIFVCIRQARVGYRKGIGVCMCVYVCGVFGIVYVNRRGSEEKTGYIYIYIYIYIYLYI